MEDLEEKKWFVYLGDHHEGPLSVAEVRNRMLQGQATPESYVWAEGMADWVLMSEVREFDILTRRPGNLSETTGNTSPGVPPSEVALGGKLNISSTLDTVPGVFPFESQGISDSEMLQVEDNVPQDSKSSASNSFEAQQKLKFSDPALELDHGSPHEARNKKDSSNLFQNDEVFHRKNEKAFQLRLRFVIVPLLVGVGYFAFRGGYLKTFFENKETKKIQRLVAQIIEPQLMSLLEKYPTLTKWISPIPYLEGVSSEDFDVLKNTAKQPFAKIGPSIVAVLGDQDNVKPFFYIASNLPDGFKASITLEGIADTLLSQTVYSKQFDVTLNKKIGKSPLFSSMDQKPLARGLYLLKVHEADQQPETIKKLLLAVADVNSQEPLKTKMLFTKKIFLGGKKDEQYTLRLKQLHDSIRKKANDELDEVKQYWSYLSGRLRDSSDLFLNLSKGSVTPSKRQKWEDFDRKWAVGLSQMNKVFDTWTSDKVERDFFYGKLFQLIIQASQSVETVHLTQGTFFKGKIDFKSFDIQLGQAQSQAQTSISVLKAKLDHVMKLPTSANGMPKREGL